MLFLHPAFHLASYGLPRDPQEGLLLTWWATVKFSGTTPFHETVNTAEFPLQRQNNKLFRVHTCSNVAVQCLTLLVAIPLQKPWKYLLFFQLGLLVYVLCRSEVWMGLNSRYGYVRTRDSPAVPRCYCIRQHLTQLFSHPLFAIPAFCFNKMPHIGIHIISYPLSSADKWYTAESIIANTLYGDCLCIYQ
jgi:hypothetical protein